MNRNLYLTTTGTQNPVVLADMGNRTFAHPTTDFDLLPEYSCERLCDSGSLADALAAGYITLKDGYGNSITDICDQLALVASQDHESIRQLIHFIDEGPSSGATLRKAVTGTVFPTSIIWYHTVTAGEKKLVEKTITWTGANPTTIVWKIYDDTETLLATVTDTISYTGVFETGRTRVIS